MLTYLLLFGIVIFALASAIWLAVFLLNQGLDTALETEREARWRRLGQVGYGILLFGMTAVLIVAYFQIDRVTVLPEMPSKIDIRSPLTIQAPPQNSGMDVTLVAGGIALSGFAFLLWLGAYMLSQSIGSTLQSTQASQRKKMVQLCAGAFLFTLTGGLIVMLFQMDKSAIIPEPTVTKSAPIEVAPAVIVTPSPEDTTPKVTIPGSVPDPVDPAEPATDDTLVAAPVSV